MTRTSSASAPASGSGPSNSAGPSTTVRADAQITHALLRPDPRTARLAPSRTVEDTDLDTEFPGPFQRGMHHAPPLRRKERMLPVGLVADADVADEGAVDTRLLHGFEIPDRPLFGDVVRHPVPVYRQRRFIGHVPE